MKYFKCKVEEGLEPIEEEISRKEYLAAYQQRIEKTMYDIKIKNYHYYFTEEQRNINVRDIFFTL